MNPKEKTSRSHQEREKREGNHGDADTDDQMINIRLELFTCPDSRPKAIWMDAWINQNPDDARSDESARIESGMITWLHNYITFQSIMNTESNYLSF